MKIKTAALSDKGGRSSNDDTVQILAHREGACVFVGDGLGSYAGGAQASRAAAEAVIRESRRGSLLADHRMIQAAQAADRAVRETQLASGGKMKTTLVALSIEDGCARWMHVGDSRLYHFQNGRLLSQTMDHSVSQVAVLMGEISAAEIRFHADRNRVLRALGGENATPEISPVTLVSRGQDVFLLCTDGFWEYVYEDEMEQTLRRAATPETWLKAMEAILRQRCPANHDNYTAAAVFC